MMLFLPNIFLSVSFMPKKQKRSFNAQIEFTMHEMKRFMRRCEKLMTAEKLFFRLFGMRWRRRRSDERERNEIEFINIDTDGRDFPLLVSLYSFAGIGHLISSTASSRTVLRSDARENRESTSKIRSNICGCSKHIQCFTFLIAASFLLHRVSL